MASLGAPSFSGEGDGNGSNPIGGLFQGFPMMYGQHGCSTVMQFQTPRPDLAHRSNLIQQQDSQLNPGPELKDASEAKGKKPQLTPEEKAERKKIYDTRSRQKKRNEEQDRKEKLNKLEKENEKLWKRNGSLKRKLESHAEENVQFRTRMKQLEHDNEHISLLLSTLEEKLHQADTNTFHREILDLQSWLETDRAYAEPTVLPYVEQNYELRIENVQLKQKIKKLELTLDALLNDKIAKEKHGKEFQE